MNTRKVVNWIGVFALALGSLISATQGSFISALFGVLFLAFLVSSLVPFPTKMAMRVSPRLVVLQRMLGRGVAWIGCWILSGVGGWQFVPAAVLLTVSTLAWPAIKLTLQKYRNRKMMRDVQDVKDHQVYPMSITNTSTNQAAKEVNDYQVVKEEVNDYQLNPPQYTSTVKIIHEECKQEPIQTPIFAV